MTAIEEMIQFLTEKKDSALELSKTYVDKSKRQKFRDFAAAYVDALVFAQELKDKEDDLQICTSCDDTFEPDTMEKDSDQNYFCKPCYEVLSPVMKAEYDEMVAKGEIEE